jgi:serine protease inhibitor
MARVTSLPFAAPSTVKSINEWASANTSGRIPTIVESLNAFTVAMLINATYFKGKWRAQFDASATCSSPFHVSASSTIQVPTMMTEKGLARTGMTSNFIGTVIRPVLCRSTRNARGTSARRHGNLAG